jgi:hypothetical protein
MRFRYNNISVRSLILKFDKRCPSNSYIKILFCILKLTVINLDFIICWQTLVNIKKSFKYFSNAWYILCSHLLQQKRHDDMLAHQCVRFQRMKKVEKQKSKMFVYIEIILHLVSEMFCSISLFTEKCQIKELQTSWIN